MVMPDRRVSKADAGREQVVLYAKFRNCSFFEVYPPDDTNSAVDFGLEWEIHPAYRWAIQPNDIQDVIDSLPDLSN